MKVKVTMKSDLDRFNNKSMVTTVKNLHEGDTDLMIEYLACIDCDCNSGGIKENGEPVCYGECLDELFNNGNPRLEYEPVDN